jgi:hypothetical protein
MHKVSYALLALPLLLLGTFAQAQTAGTITFTANRTSSSTGFAPVLTWSTSPVATSCTASGAWSGTKFASGTETLATITSSKAYTLTCTWGNGTATINWTAPTRNSDGTTLTDLTSYKVLYGNSSGNLNMSKVISDRTATSTSIGSLGQGTWYFAVRAVNSKGVESNSSSTVSKVITGASAAKTVNITITGGGTPPPTGSLQTISTRVYDVTWDDAAGVRVRGREVGTIALNKPCDPNYKVGTEFYGVNKADARITVTPRSNRVIVRCQIK